MYFFLKEPKLCKDTLFYLIYYVKKQGTNFKYSTGLKVHPDNWNFTERLPRTKRGAGGVKAKYKEKLFEDKILAWQYGPVVSQVYRRYKDFGSNGIKLDTDSPPEINLSDNQTEMIDDVYDFFKQFSAVKLMEMTHNEDPWKDTWYNNGEISLEKLYQHFKPFINEEEERV